MTEEQTMNRAGWNEVDGGMDQEKQSAVVRTKRVSSILDRDQSNGKREGRGGGRAAKALYRKIKWNRALMDDHE